MHPGTSLRSRSPAETAARARSLMRPLGLSRLTDITGLDRLGLPVFISARRGAGRLSLHAGKGLAAEDARVGAMMEGLEHAVAERASRAGPDRWMTLAELAASWPSGLTLQDFAPRLGAALDPQREVMVVRCEDLVGRRPLWLPAELVLVPCPEDGAPPLFGWSTNGLASGNTLEEATLHALLEVLERDAVAMDAASGHGAHVDVDDLPAPLRDAARRWQAQGVALIVRQLPNEFALPCFEATLHEPGHAQVELARGFGIHLDRGIALARAVSEAAQSRACKLHRDSEAGRELHAEVSVLAAEPGARARTLQRLADRSRRIALADVPHHPGRSVRGAWRELIARLAQRGFRHVLRKRMRPEGGRLDLQGLQVVKVVVPRCETVMGTAHPRMGPRLLAGVLGRRQ